jgi:hypothetical protein
MAGLVTGIVGLGISAGTTAVSFIQANNEKRKQADYEADASKALAQARKALQVNYAKSMSIQKEPYNQERLALLNTGAQITQYAAESERGAAAVAGQLLAQQQMGAADITNRQTTDMQNIENAILEEESRLRDVNVGLDMQEIEGKQQAAADSRLAAAQAKQAGLQGIANTAQAGASLIPLFQQNNADQRQALVNAQALDPTFAPGLNAASASNKDFRQYNRSLGRKGSAAYNNIYLSPQYTNAYGNLGNPQTSTLTANLNNTTKTIVAPELVNSLTQTNQKSQDINVYQDDINPFNPFMAINPRTGRPYGQ